MARFKGRPYHRALRRAHRWMQAEGANLKKVTMSQVQTAAAWRAAIKGLANAGSGDRAMMILRVYHSKPAQDIAGRKALLTEMRAACQVYFDTFGAGDALYWQFVNLSMQTAKESTTIDKAQAGWGKARQVFGSHNTVGRAAGRTNTIQHHTRGAAAPSVAGNYWLEALDPKHRSFGHNGRAAQWFSDWMAAATDLSFFDWLDRKGVASGMPQVQYLAPDQRWKYMCVFGDDGVMYRHQETSGARGRGGIPLERFSTLGLQTAHSGNNFAIWVCSPGGIFYTNAHKVSEFHHSTFLAGGRVLSAGEWVVSAGKILIISHKTGHHAASPAMLFNALLLLNQRADLSRTVVQVVDFATKATSYHTVPDFIASGGVPSTARKIVHNVGGAMVPMQDLHLMAAQRCARQLDWDDRWATAPASITASGALVGKPVSRLGMAVQRA